MCHYPADITVGTKDFANAMAQCRTFQVPVFNLVLFLPTIGQGMHAFNVQIRPLVN